MFWKRKQPKDMRIGFTPMLPPQFKKAQTRREVAEAALAASLQWIELADGVELSAPLIFVAGDNRWHFLQPEVSELPPDITDDLFMTIYMGSLSKLITEAKVERYVVVNELRTRMDGRQIDVLALGIMWDGKGVHEFYELSRDPRPHVVGDPLKNPAALIKAVEGEGLFPLSAEKCAVAIAAVKKAGHKLN